MSKFDWLDEIAHQYLSHQDRNVRTMAIFVIGALTEMMSANQERHLLSIKETFMRLVDAKYRAGQIAHGGDLWRKTREELLDEAIAESIDQVIYLLTLKEKMRIKD